ncbi:hypothetical protein CB0940_04250 [Cercospora beticola]|uniref:Uncharacterized protein n=1 Tax=Cercospora beticola TaxID=122368 RepID=A0A2G5HMR9_CERBT|nr:hypothetical protein CB0940_04250 [Cercospora beticola]PIA93502.1 hypothetical protein CB0940_04250 [Cercospora beticola]WPB01473.1 hypothetical protein RHO25_006099 [Cercospora beticola]
MCVIENKTYVYQDNHSQTIQKQYRCHNAPAEGLCNHVRERNTESARVVERRPTSSSSTNIVMADGREYRYFPLSRRSSKRSSTGRSTGNSGRQSPIDSLVSSSPPRPMSRTVRPRAPSPPAPRPDRRVSFHEPTMRRAEILDGTAVYTEVPSLAMPRAPINERRSIDPKSSISSLTNEIDDTEPPVRRSSIKRSRRPSGLSLGLDTPGTTPSSQSSPGLSELPKIYRDRPSAGTASPSHPFRSGSGNYQSLQDQEREEDERQARLIRDALAATEQRQHDRLSREVRNSARKHSEDLSRESSSEAKAKHRHATAAALTGESSRSAKQQEREREIDRRLQADIEQVRLEREAAAMRKRAEYQQQQQLPPSSPTSARTYTYVPTPPPTTISRRPISARTMTDTSSPTLSARTPRYGPAIVHQPIPPRNPLAEQGERVIQREQARVNDATKRMTEMLENTHMYDEAYDDGTQISGESSVRSGSDRRYRRGDRRHRRDSYDE